MDARDQHGVHHCDAEGFAEGAEHEGRYCLRRCADLGKPSPDPHPCTHTTLTAAPSCMLSMDATCTLCWRTHQAEKHNVGAPVVAQ